VFNVCTRWELAGRTRTADASGGGDAMDNNIAIRKGYRFVANFVLEDAATLATFYANLGALASWAGFVKAAHTNALVASQGIVEEVTIGIPANEAATIDVVIISDGTVVTLDETPAT
jgi:hypothetical protein